MSIIYDDYTEESTLELGKLNGEDGAVFLTVLDDYGDEELDVTFQSIVGLIEWATDVLEKAQALLIREAGIKTGESNE